MEYYYSLQQNISNDKLVITDDEARHLSKVLRKDAGSEIYVTDGKGNLYKCLIEDISKSEISCKISGKQFNVNEPSIKLTAYISILKNPSRFEFAIEKLTELGVYEIQPVITDRVISKEKDKSERWQQIALSAMKQSQRCILPKVNQPIDFNKAITDCKDEIKYIAHEKNLSPSASQTTRRVVDLPPLQEESGSAGLFIGPEGGFTDDEVIFAEQNGLCVLNLGSRKYRSETAAITAAALILLK